MSNDEFSRRGELRKLCRQRNRYAFCAILFSVVSLGLTLPRLASKRKEQQQLDEALLLLQARTAGYQNETRKMQANLIKTQQEITQLMKR